MVGMLLANDSLRHPDGFIPYYISTALDQRNISATLFGNLRKYS